VDWFDDACQYYHFQADRLSSLPADWQRELAALWRLEVDGNNGGYLQFLVNWGRESYVYASQALRRIGAHRMADLMDECQRLIDKHFDTETKTQEELQSLMPNPVFGVNWTRIERTSVLPEAVLARIYELSEELMNYPDDIVELGKRYYGPLIEGENRT